MSADRTPELGLNHEGVHISDPLPTEKGRERIRKFHEMAGNITIAGLFITCVGSIAAIAYLPSLYHPTDFISMARSGLVTTAAAALAGGFLNTRT